MSPVQDFPDLTLDLDNQQQILQEAQNLVLKLRPGWVARSNRTKVFSGGVTNILVGIFQDGNKQDMVLVRVFGRNTEALVDRDAERRNMKLLHDAGCGPALLATFSNGIAYEFVPGIIPTIEMAPDPKFNQLVIEMMAKMHRIEMGNRDIKTCLWDRMRQFLDVATSGENTKCGKTQKDALMSIDQLRKEIEEMESLLSSSKSPIVYCHNDLLLGNIIYNEEKHKVTFIDHEFGELNYQAYDLGNHFTEFGGVDGEIDYDRYYPSEKVQLSWLSRYLKAFNQGKNPTDAEVWNLYVEANQFALCANLKWGIWALAQAKISTIDFDFVHYGNQRHAEYLKRKPHFIALKKK